MIYATTECINKDGEILTTTLDRSTGKLKQRSRISASGKSTCFLNLHKTGKFLTAVNYWDAKLASFPVSADGSVGSAVDVDMQPGAEYVEKNHVGTSLFLSLCTDMSLLEGSKKLMTKR